MMSRQFLRMICRWLIGVVLLAQLAVTAHACPGLPAAMTMQSQTAADALADGSSTEASVVLGVQQFGDCAGMAMEPDPDFANLCAEHCRYGQQSDHAATLAVPAVLLMALYWAPANREPVVPARPMAAASSALAAAAPPLAILHCCFRI